MGCPKGASWSRCGHHPLEKGLPGQRLYICFCFSPALLRAFIGSSLSVCICLEVQGLAAFSDAFLARAQRAKVLSRLGAFVGEQFKDDAAGVDAVDRDLEERALR